MDMRDPALQQWAEQVARAAQAGYLGNRPLTLHKIETLKGPRAGALEIAAGMDAVALRQALCVQDYARHRQLVPWDFPGEPMVYMTSRYVRLEVAWPDEWAEKDIPLSTLGRHPRGGGRWIAGKNAVGATVTLGLEGCPHYLFGGYTGSGKTFALRSAVAQLAEDPANRLVLCDGKFGDGLGCLQGLRGRIGPLAVDLATVRDAFAWLAGEMRQRYTTGRYAGRIILVADEIQEFTTDPACAELLRRLTAQGRGVSIHVLVGTQNPLQGTFRHPDIKRNLGGRVALRTDSFEASRVLIGQARPRADQLLGAGDCYAITEKAVQRLQTAYIPRRELEAQRGGAPELTEWPAFDPEALGTLPETVGRNTFVVSPVEAAACLLVAHQGYGQNRVKQLLHEATGQTPGGSRADKLRDYGRTAYQWLKNAGWSLCAGAEAELPTYLGETHTQNAAETADLAESV